MEISKEIFEAMDRFELDDLRILHEFERHSEHSELTEQSLHDRAVNKGEPVEDAVLRQMQNEALYAAIQKLAEKQRRRVTLYYFKGCKIREIAEMEGTSLSTVSRSIQKAEINLKKFVTIQSTPRTGAKSEHSSKCHVENAERCREIAKGMEKQYT